MNRTMDDGVFEKALLGGGYFLEGNPDLDPSETLSYRAGIEVNPVSWLSASATGFYNEISDDIRSTFSRTLITGYELVEPDMSPGSDCAEFGDVFPELCEPFLRPTPASVYQKTNLDDVVTRGVEVRLQLRPLRSVDVHLGYTFLDTRVEDSNLSIDELPNEPRHVFDSRVTLRSPWTDTEITMRTRWRSSAIIEGSGTGLLGFATQRRSDPSVTVDLRASQPLPWGFTLFADVTNVTDNRFVDSYVVRGRSFFIGLRSSFD